jgi:pantoate--beta-alanine ligase
VVIRRMVQDLNLDLEIIGFSTVREEDGLAMSSRNTYLQDQERAAALGLSQALVLAKRLYDQGERDAARILPAVRDCLVKNPLVQLEYAKICNVVTLKDLAELEQEAFLALAAKVGRTRLIDNYVFGESLEIAFKEN